MKIFLKIIEVIKVFFFVKDDLEKLKRDIEKVFEKARKLEDKQIETAFGADADSTVSQAVVTREFDKLRKTSQVVGLMGEAKKKLD